jgi:cellulose synthase operon protein C
VQLRVACFDLQTGRLRWRSPPLCSADTPAATDVDEITHTLLSRRHGLLYVNTNLGAIAAVRVEDGQIAWLMHYPRLPWPSRDPDRSGRHYQRTLNPCLVAGDLVYAAPADSDRLFALDAITGHMRWTTSAERAVDVRHLLGVGQGNLIASGERLYWLDAATGRPVGQYPPPDEPLGPETPRGFGRGVLAGDAVYWPTQGAIFVFDQTTQRTPRGWQPVGKDVIELASRGAEGGNLIPAGSVLLIATNDTLYAFARTATSTEVPVSLTPHSISSTK